MWPGARVLIGVAASLLLLPCGPAAAQAGQSAESLRVFSLAGPFGTDIAATSDGGFLVLGGSTQGGGVYKVDSLGRVKRLVGNPASAKPLLAQASDVATTSDGGFLIADTWNCIVRRVDATGTLTTVAGRGSLVPPPMVPQCTSYEPGADIGDGGPATSASMFPTGVSPTADGGFLVVDSTNQRIRAVDASGVIRTVAGTGIQGEAPAGYGGPAIAASIRNPTMVASTLDGGFVFVDDGGIHRVSNDGTLSGLLPRPATSRGSVTLGITEHGTPYRHFRAYESGSNELRLLGEGALDLRLRASGSGFFDGDGDPLSEAAPLFSGGPMDVEPTADGGLLFLTGAGVKFAAPPGTRTLAVAVAHESLPALQHRRLRLRTTQPARVEVILRAKRRTAAQMTVRASEGLTSLRLPKTVKPGIYTVQARAVTRAGARASDRLVVLVGSRLPRRIARAAHEFDEYEQYGTDARRRPSAADAAPNPIVGPCHRFSPTRVDCVVGHEFGDTYIPCLWVGAAVLGRSGHVYTRHYPCPKPRSRPTFKKQPHWSGKRDDTQPLSSLNAS
jgi:hypothetical protein